MLVATGFVTRFGTAENARSDTDRDETAGPIQSKPQSDPNSQERKTIKTIYWPHHRKSGTVLSASQVVTLTPTCVTLKTSHEKVLRQSLARHSFLKTFSKLRSNGRYLLTCEITFLIAMARPRVRPVVCNIFTFTVPAVSRMADTTAPRE